MSRGWWVVFTRELRDLWIGGKGLHLLLLYTVLLGLYAFFLASNVEVNLLPRKEMVMEVVKTALAVSLLISMIIAADTITAERERATLEGLLLTPASRRQIVFGKFLAAISPIPVALTITIPYLAVLSKGDPVFGPATFWLFLMGALLLPLAALGMLASIWCNTTKISMLVSFALYLLMLLPAEIIRPGKIMSAAELKKALAFQSINPFDAIAKFLGQVLLFEKAPGEHWLLLTTPVVLGTIVLLLLFAVAGPRLRLEATTGRWLRRLWSRAPRAAPKAAVREPAAIKPEESFPVPTTDGRRASAGDGTRVGAAASSSRASATWWLVFQRELRDLWIGGKALTLTIGYTVVLGGYAYWQAYDSSVSLMPPKEMVFELWKFAMMTAVFMGLIVGADMISGERERSTLEGLLVTPTSRRQVLFGKYLAAASTWPAALIIIVPYTYVLAQGDDVFGQAILWGALVGTLLAPAFTALGMFVSFWCANNKTSMFVSLGIYLICMLPTQLQGRAQGGTMGLLFQALNPMTGSRHFLAGVLVNNRSAAEYSEFIVSSGVFLVLMFVLLFWFAGPSLRLEAGRVARSVARSARAAAAAALMICLHSALATPARAQETVSQAPVTVSISMTDSTLRAGGAVLFKTTVRNERPEASHALIVAMNIINLDRHGEVVDPEDWSPQRTQYIEPLGPGQATTLDWRINAILDGDFMVYMVAIPAPGSPDATSQPVASSGIHLTVTPYTRLNPGGVLPFAIGGPLVLVLVIFFVYRHRRKQIDAGGSA